MSETLEVTTARRPRSERPERTVEAREPETVVERIDDSQTPEQAIAEAFEQTKQHDQATAEARRLQREAEARAQKAERELAAAQSARATDRQTTVAAAMEAAKADQAAARLAYKAAREAGDLDGEAAAQEALAAATFRASQAASELDWLKNQPKPAAPAGQPNGPGPEAQRWLDNHPLYFDKSPEGEAYRAMCEGAHSSAIRSGIPVESPAYFTHIENLLARTYGENHGQIGGQQQRTPPMTDHRAAPRGDAAPPSRGGGNNGGYQRVRTPAGELMVQRRSDGSMGVRCTSPQQQAAFEEHAAASKMSLGDYIKDMIAIADEQAAGGDGGWVQGDGAIYR